MRPFTVLGALAAAGTAVVAGALVEAKAFKLHRVDVAVLAPGSRELRVLHISDIHTMAYQKSKLEFVRRLGGLRPDLVINTGDNISSVQAIDPLLNALSGLLGVPGVFVFGTNDKFAAKPKNPLAYLFSDSSLRRGGTPLPTHELTAAFTSSGWVDLNNAKATIDVAGRRMELRGTDDAHHGFARYDAVAGPADASVDLRLGITHAPYRWLLNAMVADGVDMVFAGHTHGGQICLPVNRALTTNCDLPNRQASGLSTWSFEGRQVPLHVSGGIGTSPFAPVRLFCRPGATLVRLVAANDD